MCLYSVRLPNGIRIQRRYYKTASVDDITLWIQHECVKHGQTHLINHSQLISTMPILCIIMVIEHYRSWDFGDRIQRERFFHRYCMLRNCKFLYCVCYFIKYIYFIQRICNFVFYYRYKFGIFIDNICHCSCVCFLFFPSSFASSLK